MIKILKLLKKHWVGVLLALVLLIVQANCELDLPGMMSDIVDIGLTRGGVPDASQEYIAQVAAGTADSAVQMRYLWQTGGKMAAVTLLAAVAAILVNLIASRIAAMVGRDLRKEVFSKVLSFSHTELDNFSTASLITRSTNDIQQV